MAPASLPHHTDRSELQMLVLLTAHPGLSLEGNPRRSECFSRKSVDVAGCRSLGPARTSARTVAIA